MLVTIARKLDQTSRGDEQVYQVETFHEKIGSNSRGRNIITAMTAVLRFVPVEMLALMTL